MFQRYLAWLAENNETQDTMPYKMWLDATFPGDNSLHNLSVVGEVVSGNLDRARGALQVSEVTTNADEDLAAGLTALARNRLGRIAQTMEFVDRVEDRLMRRVNVEEASIDQLLAAGRLLRGSLKDDVTLVAEVVRARQEKPIEDSSRFNVSFTETVVNIGNDAARMTLGSRDGRDRARNLLESMINTVRKNGPSDSTEPVV